MTECDVCEILKNKDSFKLIYEDDICFVLLHESPAIAGHTMVIPKKHATILEEIDDNIVEHLFIIANKVSSSIFDTLGAQGTNIILNNGHDAGQELPHVVLHVLPRKEGDGLNFEWPTNKAHDAELKTTQSLLKGTPTVSKPKNDPKPASESNLHSGSVHGSHHEDIHEEEEDYLIKSLKRTP